MTIQFNPTKKLFVVKVLLAFAAMLNAHTVMAACIDNGNGTHTCTGVSDNVDNATPIVGSVTLDNASGAVTLNNSTLNYENIGSQTTITNTISLVGPASTITTNGTNNVVINNTGSIISIDGNGRVFYPAGWTNDANGNLLNDGVIVGIAAAINATSGLSSFTINNYQLNDGIFHANLFSNYVPSSILNFGVNTAAINTNASFFNLNGDGMTYATIYSYGGATYTPPAILDGTQLATLNSAGVTNVNLSGIGSIFSLYVVDKNPLLTKVQAENTGLTITYNTADVGPRNSVINVSQDASITNVYLGSGAHVVNVGQNISNDGVSNIFVDQRDAEVVNVVGGVANTLYKVHGDRTFTLTSANQRGPGNVTINDVVGAVNTLNYTGISGATYGNIAANGLGNNTLNLTCIATAMAGAGCGYSGVASGMTNINFLGNSDVSATIGDFSATENINFMGQMRYGFLGQLTAQNIVIGNGIELYATTAPSAAMPQVIGTITGNLNNNGTVNVGEATLDISGTALMSAGSNFMVGVNGDVNGLLNAAGGTTFDSAAQVRVTTKPNVYVPDGKSYVIANNAIGMPIVLNDLGFLQWHLSNPDGNLVATQKSDLAFSLASQVTPAAINATNTFFTYQGTDPRQQRFLASIQALSGENAVTAAERLHPEINDGAIRMVLGNTDKLFSILDTRLVDTYRANTNSDVDSLTINSKALSANKGIWVQGFGDRGSQEAMKGADGYGISSVGMAAGVDQALDVNGNTRLGVAFGYARGNVTNDGVTVNNRLDTSSYMAMLYGSHAQDDWFVNGALGFGRHVYDTRRQLLDFTAVGNHDSWQLSGSFDAGMPMLMSEDLTLIPMVSLDYSHIKESAYRENWEMVVPQLDFSGPVPVPLYINSVAQYEKMSSPINLEMSSRSFDSIRTGLGGKVIYSIQQPDWAAEIELRAMLKHEFGDIAQDNTARFAFGSNRFSSPGIKPAKDDFTIGGSVRLTGDDENDQLTLLTSYDANIREKYFGQTMSLNLRYDFDQAPRYLKSAKVKLAHLKAKNAPQQQITATEQDIAEIQKAIQAGLVVNANNPADAEKQKAIDSTLNTWISAIINKNIDVYFNTYAANFETPDGSTRQQWERKRKLEINKEPNPDIKISYLTIEPKGNRAMAVFMQTQSSNTDHEAVQKILDLENKNGRWLIVREDSLLLD